MRAEESVALYGAATRKVAAAEHTVVAHVPCLVCKIARAPLTKYAETLWAICNQWLQRQHANAPPLRPDEVAVCSPACYQTHKRNLYIGDLEWLRRERERAEQEAEREADVRGRGRRR